MAEVVVGLLIGKLGEALLSEAAAYGATLLCTEASALKGIFGEIRRATDWLEIMQAYLQELYDINADLDNAAKQRNLCALPEGFGGGGDHHAALTNETACFAREEDLVGTNDNAEKLKGWLLGNLEQRKSKIVAVWGMGVGKTTLVDHVYKVVKEEFDVAAWVTVSKSYQVKDLLKKIAQELGISVDVSNMEMRSLGDVISNHLQCKSYILVLDDVMDVFPNDSTSRVVFTSRNFEVASMATAACPFKLEPLEDNNSWKLFCNLAFRNIEDKRCPSKLHNLTEKFLEKCDGLPLAIACIGRLLSCKHPTLLEWKKVYGELELQSSL